VVNMTKRDYDNYLESCGINRDTIREIHAAEQELISNAYTVVIDDLASRIKQAQHQAQHKDRLLRNRHITHLVLGFAALTIIITVMVLIFNY
jgi:hypothetical protein